MIISEMEKWFFILILAAGIGISGQMLIGIGKLVIKKIFGL